MINKKLIFIVIFLIGLLAMSTVSASNLDSADEIGINEDISDDLSISDDELDIKDSSDVLSVSDDELDIKDSSDVLSVSDDEWDIKDSSDVLSVSDEGDDNPLYDDNLKIKEESNLSDSISVSGNTFVDIQNAIDSANEGDTIALSGTYNGNGVQINVNKSLTILGTENTVLNAKKLSRVFNITADNVVLRNLNFVNCTSTSEGAGAIYWYGANGSLSHCSFMHCTANNYGGAVRWNGTEGSLRDCIFIDCSSTSYGAGAIRWEGMDGSLGNCSFMACNASKTTGGAVSWTGVNGSLGDCSFTGCFGDIAGAVYWSGPDGYLFGCSIKNCSSGSTPYGTVLLWAGDNGYLTNTTFENCSATYGGGGALRWTGVNGSLTNCSFIECYYPFTYQSCGGAVYWQGIDGSLANCSFVRCYSHTSAGAVYWSGDNGSLVNSSFSYCYSTSLSGGAILWRGLNGSLVNSSFIACFANGEGGAVAWSAVDGSASFCRFENCHSDSAGGAIYYRSYGGNDSLINCSFVRCYAPSGGAIFWDNFNASLVNCSFLDCSASAGNGGAILLNGADARAKNCSFNNCSASSGGALYCGALNASVADCSFVDCSASSGGALYCGALNASIANSSFLNCSASNGSALSFYHGNGSVIACSFLDCSASYGGAIYFVQGEGNLAILDSRFINNTADRNGAAIYIDGSSHIENCIFVNNSALADVYLIYIRGGTSPIESSVFENNCDELIKYRLSDANDINFDNCFYGFNINSSSEFNGLKFCIENSSNGQIGYLTPNYWLNLELDNNSAYSNEFNLRFVSNDSALMSLPKNYPVRIEKLNKNGEVLYDFGDILFNGSLPVSYSTELSEGKINVYSIYTGNLIVSRDIPLVQDNPTESYTLTDLKNLIDRFGNTVILYHNYAYAEGDNASGILIDKDLKIYANGHLVNGANKSSIFNISQGNMVIIEDMKFVNCSKGVIYNYGNLIVYNSSFKSNSNSYKIGGNVFYGDGGAIYSNGNLVIISSNFTDCLANDGGAVYSSGDAYIVDSKFEANAAISHGSDIYNGGNLSLFKNDYANLYNSYSKSNALITSSLHLVILDNSTKIAIKGNPFTLYAKLVDDNGNLIEDDEIALSIGSNPVSALFNNGTGLFEYELNGVDGTNFVSGTYDGASNLTVETGFIVFVEKELLKANATIEFIENDDSVIVSLKTLTGEPIAHSSLNISLNGEKFNLITNNSGKAKINIDGNASINAVYIDDNGFEVSSFIVVNKKLVELPINASISLKALNGKVVANLTDLDGNPISNASLVVVMNGNRINGIRTDNKGICSIDVVANASVIVSYYKESAFVSASIEIVNYTSVVEKIVYVNQTVEVPVERIVYVNQTVEVPVERIVYVNKTVEVEKIVYVNKTVEVPVEVEKIVYVNSTTGVPIVSEKIVYLNQTVEVPVEKIVYVNQTVEVPVEKIVYVNNTIGVAPNRTATKIVYSDMITTAVAKVDGRVGEYFYVTLKDAKGKALANKFVQIGFNGAVYNRTTNKTGGVRLQINLGYAGKYTFAIAFLGDDNYTGSFEVALITVNAQKPKLTTAKKTYKASAKTKALTATLKSVNGNPVSGKTLTFTVNGKSYTGKTNSKGVATVNISLNKKGTYSFTVKYDTDGMYATTSAKSSVKIA